MIEWCFFFLPAFEALTPLGSLVNSIANGVENSNVVNGIYSPYSTKPVSFIEVKALFTNLFN